MSQSQEVWKPIPGFDGYEVSNLGRVRSFRRKTIPLIMKQTPAGGFGYLAVCLQDRDTPRGERTLNVHSLVTLAFHGPRPDGLEVRHLNGDKLDNRLDNLEYATHRENIRDKARHGTDYNARKTHCAHGHAYDEANTRFRECGRRVCRACHRARERQRHIDRTLRAANVRPSAAA